MNKNLHESPKSNREDIINQATLAAQLANVSEGNTVLVPEKNTREAAEIEAAKRAAVFNKKIMDEEKAKKIADDLKATMN